MPVTKGKVIQGSFAEATSKMHMVPMRLLLKSTLVLLGTVDAWTVKRCKSNMVEIEGKPDTTVNLFSFLGGAIS